MVSRSGTQNKQNHLCYARSSLSISGNERFFCRCKCLCTCRIITSWTKNGPKELNEKQYLMGDLIAEKLSLPTYTYMQPD